MNFQALGASNSSATHLRRRTHETSGRVASGSTHVVLRKILMMTRAPTGRTEPVARTKAGGAAETMVSYQSLHVVLALSFQLTNLFQLM